MNWKTHVISWGHPLWIGSALLGFERGAQASEFAFFESNIRPILVKHCYDCHATDTTSKGGLTLDTREGLLRGGDSGAAVVPGDLAKSVLFSAIRYEHQDLAMPPKKSGGKLPDRVIADFERWILQGAPDPRNGRNGDTPQTVSEVPAWKSEAKRQWWAFQPMKPSPTPKVSLESWNTHPIDAWIHKGLDSQGLKPSAPAEAEVLLRRLCFDLVGLPPTPAWTQRLKAPVTPEVWEEIIDTLLASPHFGERWGRLWLDVARYGESTGKDLNVAFPHAWRYRDYVVQAFQKDKPFDRFILEQLAGDLLPTQKPEEKAENLIATGFLAVGPKGLGELTPRQYELDLADELVDTTSQAFLGLTLACARCHDHKFDPFTQKDYYAMAGIFLSTEVLYGTLSGPKNNQERELIALPKEANLPSPHAPITAEALAQIHEEYRRAKDRYDNLMSQRAMGREARGGRPSLGANDGPALPDLLSPYTEFPEAAPPRPSGSRGRKGSSARGGGKGPEFFIQVQVALGKMAECEAKVKSYDAQGFPLAYAMGVRDRPASLQGTVPMGLL